MVEGERVREGNGGVGVGSGGSRFGVNRRVGAGDEITRRKMGFLGFYICNYLSMQILYRQ